MLLEYSTCFCGFILKPESSLEFMHLYEFSKRFLTSKERTTFYRTEEPLIKRYIKFVKWVEEIKEIRQIRQIKLNL